MQGGRRPFRALQSKSWEVSRRLAGPAGPAERAGPAIAAPAGPRGCGGVWLEVCARRRVPLPAQPLPLLRLPGLRHAGASAWGPSCAPYLTHCKLSLSSPAPARTAHAAGAVGAAGAAAPALPTCPLGCNTARPPRPALFPLPSPAQLLVLSFCVFGLALVGTFYPYNRGSMFTALILLYALTAGGWAGGRRAAGWLCSGGAPGSVGQPSCWLGSVGG